MEKIPFLLFRAASHEWGTRGGEESIEPSLDVAIAMTVATASDIAAKTV